MADCRQFLSCDMQLLDEKLTEDSTRLFMQDLDEIEIWSREDDSKNPASCLSKNSLSTKKITGNVIPSLHALWQTPASQAVFYVLRQKYSWGRLRLSLQTLREILKHHGVFPFFLEVVHVFGLRTKDDSDMWNCFHTRESSRGKSPNNMEYQIEISYVIHYFEENNRGRGDPWSLRKTGLYHHFNSSTGNSTYIIMQPSSYIEKRTKEILSMASYDDEYNEAKHVLPHMILLSASVANWKSYTRRLVVGLEHLEEKTMFSQADYYESNDYMLRFSDRQKLQDLQHKIQRASRLLKSAAHMAKMLHRFCNNRQFIKSNGPRKLITQEIKSHQAEVVHYQSVMQGLLQRASQTCDLLTSILQYRASISTLSSAHTNNKSLTSLINIGRHGEENEKIAQKTSMNTAALTFVATLYLPATLLSAIFSSNLVEVKDEHFVVANDFWKFIVLLIPMITGTFILIIFSQKFWLWVFQKQNHVKMNESVAAILMRLRKRAPNNNKSFFILEEVRDVITERVIADAIAPHVPDHRHKEVVLAVLHHGIRLFSILSLMDGLELISEFISHRALDNRLPLTDKAELLRIAPGSDSFFDLQWEFFPWSFEKDCGHLIFSDATIIPFLSDRQIGEGADGEISVVTIPAPLQDFSLVEKNETITVVRKRIKAASNPQRTMEKFDKERECLELFHTLQHPNIIPLLGSFTISGYHSLLFPFYSLDLPTFLGKERSGAFRDDIVFVSAISALASALQVVHEVNLRSRTQAIYATSYGYHHDIRPANILVSETTFILADFGLAYPKLPITETPPFAKWSENVGSYIAPECMDEFFEPQVIGRSYDIWAFGCLLSELTTYMEQGPKGIERFRAQRTTKLYYKIPWENSYFFQGDVTTKTTTLKDGVSRWLEELTDAPQEFITPSLVAISRRMLHPQAADRPSMQDVTSQLGLVHARLLFHAAVEKIEETLAELGRSRLEALSHTVTELLIELSKLKAVGDVFGLTKTTQAFSKQFSAPSFTRFVQDCLQQIRTAISESRASMSEYRPVWTVNKSLAGVTRELKPVKPIAVAIRPSITHLCESISDQQNFNQFFYNHFLSHVNSKGALRDTEACAEDSPMIFGDVGIHAKFKRLNMALQQKTEVTNNSELILNWDQVNEQRNFSRNHHLALYDDNKGNDGGPKRVLIEWIFFSQFPDGEQEESRIQRLFDLAELLHIPKPPDFRVLDCLGFLPPKGDGMKGYGFVYPFPALPDLAPAVVQPRTLRQMFDDRLSSWSLSLGDKFTIAKALANSLCHLHRHGWLHKNIRSENVILFVDESDRRLKGGPYLIGFHHGRKDDDKFCSDVPSADSDPEALLYQHPNYNYGDTRFRKDHDRYSLGIILLELAYWKQAIKMRQQEGDVSGAIFREKLLRKYVPKVAEIMGNNYRKVTELCLGDGVGSKGGLTRVDDMSQFSLNVVQALESCHVG